MEYEEKYSRYQLHLLDESPPFLSGLPLDLNSRLVLDLGCGGGINSYYLKQNFPRASLVSLLGTVYLPAPGSVQDHTEMESPLLYPDNILTKLARRKFSIPNYKDIELWGKKR